jgi:hypothetical protein
MPRASAGVTDGGYPGEVEVCRARVGEAAARGSARGDQVSSMNTSARPRRTTADSTSNTMGSSSVPLCVAR